MFLRNSIQDDSFECQQLLSAYTSKTFLKIVLHDLAPKQKF